MAHSQMMLAKAAAGAPVTAAAWHQKKSWALVATRDHNINPDLERTDGQAGRQRNNRGSGQPRGLRFQAEGRSAFDRTGGKGVRPVAPSLAVRVLYQTATGGRDAAPPPKQMSNYIRAGQP